MRRADPTHPAPCLGSGTESRPFDPRARFGAMRPALGLGLVLALLAAPLPARAQYDPALNWHTLESPNFVLHYHDGLGSLAQRAARASEAALAIVESIVGRRPDGRIHVLLTDTLDTANGSATAFVRSEIRLYADPPDSRSELNDYEDWLWNLVVHEATHVLQLEEASGVPGAVNQLIGRLWIPNGAMPNWFTEGVAVWAESAASGGGRLRSSLFDMYLRAEILEGAPFELDDLGGSPTRWPYGGVPYLHGSHLVEWMTRRHGAEAISRLTRAYGSDPIPFGVNLGALDVLGQSWVSLHREWRAALEAEVRELEASLREQGLTEFRPLTSRGHQTGEPRFGVDSNTVLYVEDSADRRAALRSVGTSGSGDRLIAELFTGGGLAVSRDGRFAVVAQTLQHDQYYFFDDLHRVELATGRREQLTFGERLREPDLSPDGEQLVAIKRLGAGRTGLVVLPAAGGTPRVLHEGADSATLYSPRFSPDGRRIVFCEQHRGGRDVRLLDLATGEIRDLTRDRALDLDPTFDPGGRWLLFASDRTGIYNLYAYELETGRTHQVTNVLTGAFRPAVSPDGRHLAFVTYSHRGYDVAVMPYEPGKWRHALAVDLERPSPPLPPRRDLYPVRPYQPWETLLPRYWLPIAGADPFGLALGLTTSGSDVAGRHGWALRTSWGVESQAPAFEAAWTARIFRPDVSLGAASSLFGLPEGPRGSWERQSAASAVAGLPFTRDDWRLSLSAGYELRVYDPVELPLGRNPAGPLPLFPTDGLATTASAGISWSNVQSFTRSISAERGRSLRLSARLARPELGGDFSFASLEAGASTFLAMPWLEHQVLALNLAGGAGTGDLGNRRVFRLGGGIGLNDPLLDLVFMRGAWGASLRGYPAFAFAGNQYVLGNAEYRFPIADVDTGAWTLPVYLRRVHGAVVSDVGLAANRLSLGALRPSVGAELRAQLLLGYAMMTDLRLGYVRGLAEDGIHDFFLAFGSSF